MSVALLPRCTPRRRGHPDVSSELCEASAGASRDGTAEGALHTGGRRGAAQPCSIFDDEGRVSAHEQFRSGCFDDSLARGPYFLKLNHFVRLEGRWTHVRSEAGALRFEFELFDDVCNRQVKADSERGAIWHCSIAFKEQPVRAHYRGSTCVIEEAVLSEISLLRDRRPAWYGTRVRVL